jgi:hypothetical protein
MGLLVAGITGGASLIDTSRISALKREVDDHTRDIFTFYSMKGRLPGDLDRTGKIGFSYGQTCPSKDFSEPYYHATTSINNISCPFVDLYLSGISAFKPDPSDTGITASITNTNTAYTVARSNIANHGGLPFSKTYRDFIFAHRYELNEGDATNHVYGMKGETGIHLFTTPTDYSTANPKTVDIMRKIDIKFDDGIYNGGYIRTFCNTTGKVSYDVATVCGEATFFNTQLKFL